MHAFLQELRKKLPPNEIHVDTEKGQAWYYDIDGITFHPDAEFERVADEYVITVIETKVGFPVEFVTWDLAGGNGHFAHCFEKVS